MGAVVTEPVTEPSKPRRRSGSEQRERSQLISFRVAPSERAALDAAAERAGLSLGAYIREAVIAAPKTRGIRRPSVEVQAVTRLQAEMNRVGGNIHQICAG